MNLRGRLFLSAAVLAVLAAGTVSVMTAQSRRGMTFELSSSAQLAAKESDLTRRLATLSPEAAPDLLPEEMKWGGVNKTEVELLFQQAILGAASSAGMTLLSFNASAPQDGQEAPGVSLDIELQGDHETVAAFLGRLENLQPPVAVSYLWMRQLPADPTLGGAPVSMRLTVWGFTRAEEASP